ncbi:hypothetical protein F4861DRAFT_541684 [Xylaria intraflava]|nr:hypothetical protein F4861DRAFT_541684 [Xylaria intraflava]
MAMTKQMLDELHPTLRAIYEEEREERLNRKIRRTKWKTGATEEQKQTSLRIAMNGMGRKYSWLQQEPLTVAQTLGQKRAVELGIKDGKLAKELKIGKYDTTLENGGPKHLKITWAEMRGSGFNMTKEEFEKSLRDSGMSEDEIRVAMGDEVTAPAQSGSKKPKVSKDDRDDSPKSVVISLSEMREAGFDMSKEDYEKELRDAGTPEDEIRAAIGDDIAGPGPRPVSEEPKAKNVVIPWSEMEEVGFGITKEQYEQELRDIGTSEEEIRIAMGEDVEIPASKPASEEPKSKNVVISWTEMRDVGFGMTKEQYEQELRDAGTPEDDIRIAMEEDVDVLTPPTGPTKRRKRDSSDDGSVTEHGRAKKMKKTGARTVSALATPPLSSPLPHAQVLYNSGERAMATINGHRKRGADDENHEGDGQTKKKRKVDIKDAPEQAKSTKSSLFSRSPSPERAGSTESSLFCRSLSQVKNKRTDDIAATPERAESTDSSLFFRSPSPVKNKGKADITAAPERAKSTESSLFGCSPSPVPRGSSPSDPIVLGD